MEIYEIVDMMQFKTKLGDLFNNLEPIELFLMELGMSQEDIQAIFESNLNIPGVRCSCK